MIMFVCKFAVGFSAHVVHRHLAPTSRRIAGNWVLVLSISKFVMALCALALAVVYMVVAAIDTRSKAFCLIGYVFVWSLLLSNVFQSGAGFALFSIHKRAVRFAGNVA